jgi:hypothetical protein
MNLFSFLAWILGFIIALPIWSYIIGRYVDPREFEAYPLAICVLACIWFLSLPISILIWICMWAYDKGNDHASR